MGKVTDISEHTSFESTWVSQNGPPPKQQQQQEVERHEAVLDLLGYAAGKKKNFSLLTPPAKKDGPAVE